MRTAIYHACVISYVTYDTLSWRQVGDKLKCNMLHCTSSNAVSWHHISMGLGGILCTRSISAIYMKITPVIYTHTSGWLIRFRERVVRRESYEGLPRRAHSGIEQEGLRLHTSTVAAKHKSKLPAHCNQIRMIDTIVKLPY
jgi:hypothetical protein